MIVVMYIMCHWHGRISYGTCAMHATANSCDLNSLRHGRISIGILPLSQKECHSRNFRTDY
jgi:hypothetical protein